MLLCGIALFPMALLNPNPKNQYIYIYNTTVRAERFSIGSVAAGAAWSSSSRSRSKPRNSNSSSATKCKMIFPQTVYCWGSLLRKRAGHSGCLRPCMQCPGRVLLLSSSNPCVLLLFSSCQPGACSFPAVVLLRPSRLVLLVVAVVLLLSAGRAALANPFSQPPNLVLLFFAFFAC